MNVRGPDHNTGEYVSYSFRTVLGVLNRPLTAAGLAQSVECLTAEREVAGSKALNKLESLSNGSRIKSELDQSFSRLPYDFSYVLYKVGSCRNRLNTSSNFCSTFARHSFKARN